MMIPWPIFTRSVIRQRFPGLASLDKEDDLKIKNLSRSPVNLPNSDSFLCSTTKKQNIHLLFAGPQCPLTGYNCSKFHAQKFIILFTTNSHDFKSGHIIVLVQIQNGQVSAAFCYFILFLTLLQDFYKEPLSKVINISNMIFCS